ncbi:hypothetical protein A6A03_13095 [Chloroflexus islandicus]|uniref:Galactose oxidase n=1 Tax=Chloroflexus islandicus TaxID=1707952 RepID=A0A178MDU4_9CHLR|nr:hypothetical protein [Chloroflexus islandicus]OAN46195.1 hypothetical protein A6A03_13095 [Chloroflexus islandicus]
MMLSSRLRRPFALLAALALLALLLPAWPPAPARALTDEVGTEQIIDNTQAEFASGTFQRTVVSAAPLSPTAPDVTGAIELAPVGKLNRNNWRDPLARLPQPLSDAPVVALGRYLFVISGATNSAEQGANRSPYIYRGVVNQATGSLETRTPVPPGNDVFTAFNIPAVEPGPQCPDRIPIAGRSRASAVAVPATAGSNLGYIFIVGGSVYNTTCQDFDFSTNVVQRATVDANGNIVSTGWSAPNNWRFPTLDDAGNIITNPNSVDLRGVQNLQLVHVRTSTGNDFIYAIGGLSIAPLQFLREETYPYVFYTKVDATNGNLVHPTNPSSATVWARLADLPFELHSGTAIASYATRLEGGVPVQKEAIFLLGGCTNFNCTTLNTSIRRADVNPNTGALTWTTLVGRTGDTTLPISVNIQGRQGVTGLSFNNRLYYVTGSITSNAAGATATIPVAIYNDQFLLEDLTGSGGYVVGTDENNDAILPSPHRRLNASVAIVPALPSQDGTEPPNAAWVYVVGGSNQGNEPTDTIFVGGVGGVTESEGTNRASEGWYYSQPFPVLTDGETSRLLAIKWFTDLNRPDTNPEADIRIQFRSAVTSGTCSESDFDPSTSSTNPERWRDLDTNPDPVLRSLHGLNSVRLINAFPGEEIQATCMQYRAQFIQDASSTPASRAYSPKLYYFAVEKVVAARPDILIDTFEVQTNSGSFTRIALTLHNLRRNNPAATRSVAAATNDGTFFVDLCIARRTNPATPALTAVPAPDPNAGNALPACATVSAQVPKTALGVDARYTVPMSGDYGWFDAQTGLPADWNAIFGTPGTYDIGIVVDYNALTGEDAQGRSNNRGENVSPPNGIIRTITITAPPSPEPDIRKVFVPVIYR